MHLLQNIREILRRSQLRQSLQNIFFLLGGNHILFVYYLKHFPQQGSITHSKKKKPEQFQLAPLKMEEQGLYFKLPAVAASSSTQTSTAPLSGV